MRSNVSPAVAPVPRRLSPLDAAPLALAVNRMRISVSAGVGRGPTPLAAFDAALMAAGSAGTIYNVASGIGHTIRSVLDALVARARVPVRIETDPARLRPSDLPVLIGDYSRLRETTGWHPSISFNQMLDDLLDYWRRAVSS